MNIQILQRPVITEKSLHRASKGWFTFVVDRRATKPVIKASVEQQFGVKVDMVTTMVVKGATRRVGKRRIEKHLAAYKKAFVHLPNNQKIDLFEITT